MHDVLFFFILLSKGQFLAIVFCFLCDLNKENKYFVSTWSFFFSLLMRYKSILYLLKKKKNVINKATEVWILRTRCLEFKKLNIIRKNSTPSLNLEKINLIFFQIVICRFWLAGLFKVMCLPCCFSFYSLWEFSISPFSLIFGALISFASCFMIVRS